MDLTPAIGRARIHPHVHVDIHPSRPNAASGPRSSASYVRSSPHPAVSFDRLLNQAQSSTHVVQKGDTLSEIVHNQLRAMGRPASGAELYNHVREVAQANAIANPDIISVGQSIDLSTLDGRGGAAHRIQNRSSDPAPLAPSRKSSPNALHHIVPGNTRISSGFGPRQDPFDGTVSEHRGIDIAARRGTPIFPAQPGTVIHAGWHGGHGKTVIVRHDDGSETLYAHADRLLVAEGQRVRKSDKLGLVGSTGRSTGPHLHFEMRRDGAVIDPLAALEPHAIR